MAAFKFVLSLVCSILMWSGVSSQPNSLIQQRIIGGYDAAINHFTYQVSIRFVNESRKDHICSGTILTQRYVLTASSCVFGLKSKDIQVYYGTRFLTHDGKITKVLNIHNHPEFNEKSLANNIAVLCTSSDMKFVDHMIGPVVLPTQQEKDLESKTVILSGWGATHRCAGTKTLSDRLQYKTTKLISRESCMKYGTVADFVHETSMCTLGRDDSVSAGDLGSPLILKNNEKPLLGIVSWYSEKEDGKPDVFTAVHPFLPWIKDILKSKK